MKRIVVTGGAGQIAYSLLFRIASGELLGQKEPFALHILELEASLPILKGVQMELEDCAFPLLKEIHIGCDPREIFQEADYAFLVGAKPRGPGMERKDLLLDNAKIFMEQGKALNEVARQDVKVLVVGNPCNTNCLIARSYAKRISKDFFFAMTRLDQNRAMSLLAQRAKVAVSDVADVIIWGNHSSTQVPDFLHAKIGDRPVQEVLSQDLVWLKGEFIEKVQKRGAEVIAARGKSSAASAASAAIDAMRSILEPSNRLFSMALSSDQNPYGIPPGLIFSFPCIQRQGQVEIVAGKELDSFLQEKRALSEQELLQEKKMIQSLLGG